MIREAGGWCVLLSVIPKVSYGAGRLELSHLIDERPYCALDLLKPSTTIVVR